MINPEGLGNSGESTGAPSGWEDMPPFNPDKENSDHINEYNTLHQEIESDEELLQEFEENDAVLDELLRIRKEKYGDQNLDGEVGGERKNLREKAKKHPALKRALLIAGTSALAAAIAAVSFFAGAHSKNKEGESTQSATESEASENATRSDAEKLVDDAIAESTSEVNLDDIENGETISGIKDGYGEKGMFLSENKAGPYNFAAAAEVAEVCNDDEVEMVKYTAENQVESFADYLANLPEQLQPEGFKGLSILETEKKLESLSNEEYDTVRKQFNENMDKAFTRRVIMEGDYQNAYMKRIDSEGEATHGNMAIVDCTTHESQKTVNQFYWIDETGNEIGSMTVKIIYDENGNIVAGCMQVGNIIGSHPNLYKGLEEVEDKENPPKETPPEEKETPPEEKETPPEEKETPPEEKENPPEDETLAPKNKEAEKENAGPDVTPQELDETKTPKTTYGEDTANFDEIEKQKADDAAKAAEAERVKKEQAEAESKAAEEAEQRRTAEEASKREEQAKLDEQERQAREAEEAAAKQRAEEAAARAAEEAAREQAAAAEAEQRRAAEEAARARAQAEAEAAASANSAEATSNEGANAEERANMFNNGDY